MLEASASIAGAARRGQAAPSAAVGEAVSTTALRRALQAFRRLNVEQKAAAVGALLLIASTFGPFSFVEAAEILIALGVLALLRARADGKRFHLPFGDGTAIAAAGIWAGLLIVVRLFDRPLGQNLLALACAAILFLAGVRERAKRPADDLPPELEPPPDPRPPAPEGPRPTPRRETGAPRTAAEDETEPLPPPEFEPHRPQSGRQQRVEEPEEESGS
jgi:hypothetical protein